MLNQRFRVEQDGTDLFASQDMKGKAYDEIAKTYQITFIAYPIFESSDNFISEFKFRDCENEILTEDLSLIFIELSKLKNILNKPVDEMTELEKWGIFLQYADDRDKIDILNRIIETKGEIAMGSALLKSISQDEYEQARLMSKRKYQTDMESAIRVNFRTGEAKGKAEGRAEGRAEGESKSKNDIAKNMLQIGMDIDVIAKVTGLSKGDIQEIGVRE